ncbi:hypothetical protein E2320_014510 [Naja naja]|nr:hypothetical protein E2320_014510 [Naja naja]
MDSASVMGGGFVASWLNKTNYLSWCVKMQMYLQREELWMIVTDPPAVLDDGNWRQNAKTLASIILALEDSQLIHSISRDAALRRNRGAAKKGHRATQHMKSGSSSSFYSLAATSSENTRNTWLLDSGASQHIANDPQMFSGLSPAKQTFVTTICC